MCDIVLAPPETTTGRFMLFGKNSDRQRNEAQVVEYHPGHNHAPGRQMRCTYIEIPQARRTHAVLICRPYWIWGAEMGANEHGVVIGNEGLYARGPIPQQEALIGMDLIRLGLERASSAAEAVCVLTQLLKQYGQGGNCGHLVPAYYHNGFMIADYREGFVVETIGREWLVERVRGTRAMSNAYSIGDAAEQISPGLITLVRDSGWSAATAPNYGKVLADPEKQHMGTAGARLDCSNSLLKSRGGMLEVANIMNILRDHGSGRPDQLGWQKECVTRRTLCMHAGAGDGSGQTVGSLVSQVGQQHAVHWVTATAAPCISIFKPVLMGTPLPDRGSLPTDRFDAASTWWRHERLHRAALQRDFGRFVDDVRSERDELEANFRSRVDAVVSGGSETERTHVIAECWRQASETEDRWYTRLQTKSPRTNDLVDGTWARLSQLAGMEPSILLE